ncbi:MAG: DHHA1 domain-containing protein [Pseudomonadales bacterium]|nr:DHHA1 domain-containing protein [Pseudomonadales bacterium]
MANNLVIYHGGGCLDGFGAALAAFTYFEGQQIDAEFYGASHGPIKDIDLESLVNTTVYLVDFAYKKDQMKLLCAAAKQVIVLDHHISAMEDLEGLDNEIENLTLEFDMNRSGAVITWDYFHKTPVPFLLRCIQDRDLWQFKEPNSQAINAALMSRDYDFEQWTQYLEDEALLNQLVPEGDAINRFREQMIQHHAKRAVMGNICGYEVPVVNCPREIVSELVGRLADGYPFAAGYCDRGAHRGWSLRSTADGIDVSDIAVKLGGGGHPRAAGFSTQISLDSININQHNE